MTIKTGKIFSIVIAALIISACKSNNNSGADKQVATDSNMIEVYTFPAQQGFGYSIIVNGKEFIHQDCIPVIQGNKPFTSKQQAIQAGKLVAQKISSKQLPTLTLEELKNIGVIQH